MNFARQPWLIPLLLVLVILLFGANKLPGLARNMGQSMRIFKSEVSEMRKGDDDKNAAERRDERVRDDFYADDVAHRPEHVAERETLRRDSRDYDPRVERPVMEQEAQRDDLYRRD